jgi:hypothetical protein
MSEIHKILRLIDEESRRQRSEQEQDAARRYVLGQGSLREWLEASRASKSR